ncbi:MAG: lipid A biosynthesis acyltransferase [Comamonadaceae bacterium]|nr:MAG: lipid A biosynthesis acyltransferase [Comamonadaceae bacterium]
MSRSARAGIAFMRLLARVPLPVVRGFGRVMGRILHVLAVPRRRVVDTNLALCFPGRSPTERRRIARETFVHVAQAWLDRGWLWHAPREVVERRLNLHGALHEFEGDMPTIVFAPHFCGLDAGGTALSLAVHRPWTSIFTPQRDPAINDWLEAGRTRFHAEVQVFDRTAGVKPIVSGLRKGGLLYLLPDMNFGPQESIFVPFYGVPAATVPSLSRFARLGRAKVVPVISKLTPQGYDLEVLSAWQNFPTADVEADTALMNERLAGWIDTMPSQYYWVHRRFKTRPPGEPPVY